MTNLHLSCNENVTNSLILDDKFVKSSLMVHLWWRKLVSVTKIFVYFKLMTKFHESSQNGNYSMTFFTSVITIFVTDAHISCSVNILEISQTYSSKASKVSYPRTGVIFKIDLLGWTPSSYPRWNHLKISKTYSTSE